MSFDRAIASAKKLITKYGRPVTLVHFETIGSTPWQTEGAKETSQSTVAVFLSANRTERGVAVDQQQAEGVTSEERKLLMPADGLTVAPKVGCEVRVSDVNVWRVVSVQPLAPSGQDILYTLTVKR